MMDHVSPSPLTPPLVAVDSFNFNFVVSSGLTTGSFRIAAGGNGGNDFATDLTGVVTVPYTGGWQKYENLAV